MRTPLVHRPSLRPPSRHRQVILQSGASTSFFVPTPTFAHPSKALPLRKAPTQALQQAHENRPLPSPQMGSPSPGDKVKQQAKGAPSPSRRYQMLDTNIFANGLGGWIAGCPFPLPPEREFLNRGWAGRSTRKVTQNDCPTGQHRTSMQDNHRDRARTTTIECTQSLLSRRGSVGAHHCLSGIR